GQKTQTVEETFDASFAITKRSTRLFTHDDLGRMVKESLLVNENADDTIEIYANKAYGYDEHGNQVTETTQAPNSMIEVKRTFKRLYEILGQGEPQVAQ
ncbi:MAG: hypothetical protein ACREP8_11940, partial [Candidatus Binatia bacterium]